MTYINSNVTDDGPMVGQSDILCLMLDVILRYSHAIGKPVGCQLVVIHNICTLDIDQHCPRMRNEVLVPLSSSVVVFIAFWRRCIRRWRLHRGHGPRIGRPV